MMSSVVEPSDLRWDGRGLLPVVIQDVRTGEVLALARINGEALARTRRTGVVHLWDEEGGEARVEEAVGGMLHVVEVRVSCTADVLLLRVNPAGPTGRSGEWSCFHGRLAPPRALSAIAWGHDAAEGDE